MFQGEAGSSEYGGKYAAQAAVGGSNAIQKQTEFEQAMQRISSQLQMIMQHSNRLERIADRIVGSHPKDEGATSAGNGAATAPLASQMALLSDILSRINGELDNTAVRLEAFI